MIDRIVLDTSAYSGMRRGHPAALDAVSQAAVTIVPTIVLGELEAGFRKGSRPRENLRALEEFLELEITSIAEVRRSTSRRYGEIHARLRQQGTPIPTNDIWIAAVTIDLGAHLVTYDQHFAQVDGLSQTRLTA